MSDQNSSQPAGTIADATIISRSPSVLSAVVDGEIVILIVERVRYFVLDLVVSDIWKLSSRHARSRRGRQPSCRL